MADELHGHSGPAVERGLERKYREHERDESADRFHAAAAPGPHLGRNEINDRNLRLPSGAGQAQIELREVDQYEDRGPVGALEHRAKLTVGAVQSRHLTERLAAANHGLG